MLFHAIANVGLDYTFGGKKEFFLLHDLIKCGNIGVEIFLFCSGVFLYFSYYRNPNIKNFIVKRFARLFYPVIVINGVYWIWKWGIAGQNIERLISNYTLLDFWISGDQQIWFVSMILISYVLYPYIYGYLYENEGNKELRCLVLLGIIMLETWAMSSAYPDVYKKIEIGFTRFPVFICGCLAGYYVYEKKDFPKWSLPAALIGFCVSFHILRSGTLQGMWKRYFCMIPGFAVIIILIWLLKIVKCEYINRFLSFFGRISLNLYIAHITIIQLYKLTSFYEEKRLLHYAVILVLSVVIGWVAEKIIGCIQNVISRKG